MPAETRFKSASLNRATQHLVVVDAQRFWSKSAFAAIRKPEPRGAIPHLEPDDEKGRRLDFEVTPVVTIREDPTSVVWMASDPCWQRGRQAPVFDRRPIVKPTPMPIHPNGALPRASIRRGQTEEFGMVARLHGSVVASRAVSSLKHSGDLAATRRYYDEFAERYDSARGGRVKGGYHDLIDDLEIDFLQRFASGVDVLEVGCGTGLLLERIASFARHAEGVDLSPGMLAAARTRGLKVAEASATLLPYDDESFDVTCSFKVLAHVADIRCALAEMTRVTRRGGTLVAEFYNPLSLRALAKRWGPAGKVGDTTTEAAVYTRFDRPLEAGALFPPGVRLIDRRGVRIVTPTASSLHWPVLGALLRSAEWRLCDSPFANLAGFWIGAFRKE